MKSFVVILLSVLAVAIMFAIAIGISYVIWEYLGLKEINEKFKDVEEEE